MRTNPESARRALGIDENESVWLTECPPYESEPPLAADIAADVVVIGGGLTGVSSAYQIARRFPDRRVVLVEARSFANGASGRAGGLVLGFVAGSYPTDPEKIRRQAAVTDDAARLIESMIAEHGLDVPFRRTGTLDVLTDPQMAEEAAQRADLERSAGVDVRFLEKKDLDERLVLKGAVAAVLDPDGGQINPAAFVRAMKPVLLELGVEVYEDTPVVRIVEGKTITVETTGGTLRAPAIVLATNAYSASLGYHASHYVPLHSHVVATAPLTEAARAELGWKHAAGFEDDRDRISYGSMSNEGRVVFGGGSNAAYSYAYGGRPGFIRPGPRAFGAIESALHRYLPGTMAAPITHRWSGTLAVTLSRIPMIGVTGAHRNVYYGVGYSGCGIALATIAGRIIRDIYSDDDERWRGLSFVHRRPDWIPPEPLRSIGYAVYTRATGRSPRRRPVAI